MGVAGPSVRYLALGDSYTIGESVPSGDAWPSVLAARLALEPTIVATTGWTSGELLDALDRDPPVGRFGLVSLQIGVNDQYRGLALGEFLANAAVLLDRARQLCHAAAGVFAVSIPDWGVTPFAEGRDREEVAADIDRFNEALSELTAKARVPLADVTAISRAGPGLVASDGLHPSAGQYRRWVEVITPVAEAVLRRRAG
jgi:lysophospholipase L1-like esterase